MQSKFDLAKEAYQAIISANGMPQHIQSVAWRQLGMCQNTYMFYAPLRFLSLFAKLNWCSSERQTSIRLVIYSG